MNKLAPDEVDRIAALARINLSTEEKSKLAVEMAGILDYVGKLSKVNVEGIEPTAQVTGLENVTRADDQMKDIFRGTKPATLLEQAPEREGDHIKVKVVLKKN